MAPQTHRLLRSSDLCGPVGKLANRETCLLAVPAPNGFRYRLRDRALFDLAIDSKLRSRDLANIKIGRWSMVRIDRVGHLGTRQYARLVDEWMETLRSGRSW